MEKKLIRLTAEQMEWLRKQARHSGTPLNVLIRQIISERMQEARK